MAGPAVLTVADTIARSFLAAVEKRGDRPAFADGLAMMASSVNQNVQ